jgi:hypothetical protein
MLHDTLTNQISFIRKHNRVKKIQAKIIKNSTTENDAFSNKDSSNLRSADTTRRRHNAHLDGVIALF